MTMRPVAFSRPVVLERHSRDAGRAQHGTATMAAVAREITVSEAPRLPDRQVLMALIQDAEMLQRDRVLLALAAGSARPQSVSEVRSFAVQAGLRAAWSWNISAVLRSLHGRVVRTPIGWRLTAGGCRKVNQLARASGHRSQAN